MVDKFEDAQASLLKHYVDHMSEVQRMLTEPQKELQQLRQDARTDGLNVDALNLLVQVRSRNLPDGGQEIVTKLLEYALSIGIPVEQLASSDLTLQTQWHRRDILNFQEDSNAVDAKHNFSSRSTLSIQIALGVLLSTAMLWYLL